MQIDLRTISIKPIRNTFDHIARRFGDKPASRYQEGTYDMQGGGSFHYRPTWDPQREHFDAGRTAIEMNDWDTFKDPRQFYYGSWTINRSRMQDSADAKFRMVEERGLAELAPAELNELAVDVLLPMRHLAWGGNMNNTFICTYGFGATITQPAMYQAMDYLGVAQYLTRMGLVLGGPEVLDQAKQAWMDDPMWQGLRKYTEDSFVKRDWFELFVAQNLVLDGILIPLIFDNLDAKFLAGGASGVSMMTRFIPEWSVDATKWIDSVIKLAAKESDENKELLSKWAHTYRELVVEAIEPVAIRGFGDKAAETLNSVVTAFTARCNKLGLTLSEA